MRMTFKRLALLGGHPARTFAKLADLTQARLDFVLALTKKARCQREIAEVLCVSEAVISRMVRVLVGMDLVQRHIPVADKRFRIVSLTDKGRARLDRLDDHEIPTGNLDVDGQGLSESQWLDHWRWPLQKFGLSFLATIAKGDCVELDRIEPPYSAMRMHHRSGVYRDFYGEGAEVTPDSKWLKRLPRPPRLERGLVLDTSLAA